MCLVSNKNHIRTLGSGVDFLGYVIRPHHRLMRTKTKRRILRKYKKEVRAYKAGEIDETALNSSMQSFLGALSHADTHKVQQELKNLIWLNK